MNKFIFVLTTIFLLSAFNLSAQTFGFGCLGLSGFYGGYGQAGYDATGLNQKLEMIYQNFPEYDNLKFKESSGFRFGANIIRANFENVFITAKGFYQFAKEEKAFEYDGSSNQKDEFELTTNHWGFGIDFGMPVFGFLDLKLIEGGVTFYNVKFKSTYLFEDEQLGSDEYESKDTDIGYYVATGLIIDIIEGYISLEGTAIYNFYQIDNIFMEGAPFIEQSIDKPFIEKGGFGAAVQLNVGFPL